MNYTKKGFINPLQEEVIMHKVFSQPIIIRYEYIVEETSIHYFVSIVGRTIGLNKCSIKHNEKEKTFTLLPNSY